MRFDHVEYKIPLWAISPLVYGDSTACTDEEDSMLDEFARQNFKKFGLGHWEFPANIDEEASFGESDLGCVGDYVTAFYKFETTRKEEK